MTHIEKETARHLGSILTAIPRNARNDLRIAFVFQNPKGKKIRMDASLQWLLEWWDISDITPSNDAIISHIVLITAKGEQHSANGAISGRNLIATLRLHAEKAGEAM